MHKNTLTWCMWLRRELLGKERTVRYHWDSKKTLLMQYLKGKLRVSNHFCDLGNRQVFSWRLAFPWSLLECREIPLISLSQQSCLMLHTWHGGNTFIRYKYRGRECIWKLYVICKGLLLLSTSTQRKKAKSIWHFTQFLPCSVRALKIKFFLSYNLPSFYCL